MSGRWCVAAVLLSIVVLPMVRARGADQRPNVVVILVDDLGYGDLTSYGAPDLRTPHIDRLIGSGLRFDRFYANAPVCSPTRAALLTGRYPDTVGVPGVIRTNADSSWGYLNPNATLLSQVLLEAGYDTAIVGKWHLGLESPNLPQERGFRHVHAFLGDMMDDYWTHLRQGHNYMRLGGEPIDPDGHATDLFTDWAIEYLRSRQGSDQPFFLYLAYNAPHTPIQPPPDWLETVLKREPDITPERAKLVALIEHLDDGIGRVMAALDSLALSQNTLLIFTSDNGGQLSVGARCGENRGGKQDLYEGGIRVPAGIVWPGHTKPGTTTQQMALSFDLFPTICEAAGVAGTGPVDGQSLLPLIDGGEQTAVREPVFWMRREGGVPYQGKDYHAVRQGAWKLVQNKPFERYQLYNLESDPLEADDQAEVEPAIYARLARALQIHIQQAGAIPWQTPSVASGQSP